VTLAGPRTCALALPGTEGSAWLENYRADAIEQVRREFQTGVVAAYIETE